MSQDISYRYAKALYDLDEGTESLTTNLKNLRQLQNVFQDVEVVDFLTNPNLSDNQKEKALDGVFRQLDKEHVQNFLKLILKRKKIEILPMIVTEYEKLIDNAHGCVRGTVYHAHAITSAETENIHNQIESVVKKKVILNYEHTPDVVGGLKVQVGNLTFDDTLKTHFNRLNDHLKRSH